ncbi:hypothetical protein EB118_23415 [bacterium]|nr:hypothetical protein [bacterium]NDG33002.1 hypothetical protein [bacterium]
MLAFDKASHSYRNIYTDEQYVSATTLLNKFKKKFDADFHAKRTAAKEGVTPEEIKARWKKMNEESKVKGSAIHEAIDAFNKTGEINDQYKDLLASVAALGLYDVSKIKCEELVYNHVFKLAGTADIIEDLGSSFNVYDFKTNKKFNLFSPYGANLLDPVSHLSDCEYNIYALQLSLYAFMYKSMTGKRVGKLAIIYLTPESKTEIYQAPYLYTDIKNLLVHV